MKSIALSAVLVVSLFVVGIFVPSVQAATSVGKAIISIGKVSTTNKDGVKAKLKRRGKVFEGDTITVGKKSRLQLRFIDNQLVILKANTVFRIDEYKFKDKNDNNKSAALSLLKGGMRSVTGLIGKSARDKYKVKTPVATMGVRGTHYVIQICSGDCGDGVKGIVGTVLEGSIVMTNDAGTQEFGTDQFFNVPSGNEAPKAITNPPAILVSRTETSNEENDAESITKGKRKGKVKARRAALNDALKLQRSIFTAGEQDSIITDSGVVNIAETFITPTQAPFAALLTVAGIIAEADGAGGIIGQQGLSGVIGIASVGGVGNQPVAALIADIAGDTVAYRVRVGATAFEQGGNATLGISWGRWANSDVEFRDNGVSKPLLTGLAFVYSPNPTLPSVLTGFTSTNIYNIAAGPSVRDETGAIVTPVGNFGLTVDFSGGAITAFGGTLNGNGRTYGVSLVGQPVPLSLLAVGGDFPISSSCSGCPGGITTLTGSAGGGFVGPGAEALIGYFGLNDTAGTVGISGAGVFTPAAPPM